jgi:hypothetical protein
MPDSYFVGFRPAPLQKYATLLGVEPRILPAGEVLKRGFEHNIYVRSFRLLNWTMSELRQYLFNCEHHDTKFVCLDEGFCHDSSIPLKERKKSRNYTVMQCKIPETGNSLINLMMKCKPEDPPTKKDDDIDFRVRRAIIDDYFKTSPTNPNRHLYTIDQLAHLHGYSVSSVRRLIEKTMEQLDVDLKKLKDAKLLRKAESEFKRKKVVVIMQERNHLEARRHDLKTWMKLVYERLQTIEDEVTRNVKEAKTNIGSMSVDQQSKFFVRNRSIKKTAETVKKIKSEVEKYNEVLSYVSRRLSKIPDHGPGIS